jgi:hypothetical protein
MHGVAAKVAQEVAVLLHDQRPDPGARKEQPRHHPRGTAADDQQIGVVHRPLARSRKLRRHPPGSTAQPQGTAAIVDGRVTP